MALRVNENEVGFLVKDRRSQDLLPTTSAMLTVIEEK